MAEACGISEDELHAIRETAMEFAGIGLYRFDLDGRVLFMDRRAMAILDLADRFPDPAMVWGRNIADLLVYQRSGEYRLRDEIRKLGHVCDLEVSFQTLSGKKRWVQHDSWVVTDGRTGCEAIQVLIRDITVRKEAQEKLRLWATVFEASGEGIVILDEKGRIIDINAAGTEISGLAREEVLGTRLKLLSANIGGTDMLDDILAVARGSGCWQGEAWNRKESGAIYPLAMSLSGVPGGSGQAGHFIGIFQDITQAKRTTSRLERLAHYDALTGLPNRVLFRDRLEQAMFHAARRGEPVALLFLDLDGFKGVNDTLGHAAGDTLLMLVAERLRQVVRQTDTVSRLAGDEFTIILADLQDTGLVTEIAERIVITTASPFSIGDQIVRTSASVGVAMFPADSSDPDDLMDKADAAMYHAKQSGRGRHCFYSPGMARQGG